MRLSFQEVRQRAIQFGHDWKDETSERAEAQTFWNEFFNVFGIHRRSVASFAVAIVTVTPEHFSVSTKNQCFMDGCSDALESGKIAECPQP